MLLSRSLVAGSLGTGCALYGLRATSIKSGSNDAKACGRIPPFFQNAEENSVEDMPWPLRRLICPGIRQWLLQPWQLNQ